MTSTRLVPPAGGIIIGLAISIVLWLGIIHVATRHHGPVQGLTVEQELGR